MIEISKKKRKAQREILKNGLSMGGVYYDNSHC